MERVVRGGSTVGDLYGSMNGPVDERQPEWADEPAPSWRDSAPDPLAPIDPNAPVSGHLVTPPPERPAASLAPEHEWSAAVDRIFPLLRPTGTAGIPVTDLDPASLAATANKSHAQPIVDEGPCGLAVVYAIAAAGFDVIVNGDHMLSWGVGIDAIQDAALRNLATWSASAAWSEESSGARRLISSDTGDGWDATRILLPEVRDRLAHELGPAGRVLVALPDRHLLVAGALAPDDPEFGALFQDFVVEQSGGSDEPVDRRVFELVDGRLQEFGG